MAVTVSTWAEFKDAVGSAREIVELANDIDCANEPVTSTINFRCAQVIGHDHKITRIINTGSNSTFTYVQNNTVFDHVKFTDIYHLPTSASAAFLYGGFTFNDCQFQGAFKYFVSGGAYFNRCTFSFADGTTGSSPIFENSSGSLKYCWVDLGEQTFNNTNTYVIRTSAENCYFKGKLNGNFNRVAYSSNYCVWNIYSTVAASISNASGTVSLNNSDRAPNFTGATNLTDVQLKDRAAVQATGFPLIDIGG